MANATALAILSFAAPGLIHRVQAIPRLGLLLDDQFSVNRRVIFTDVRVRPRLTEGDIPLMRRADRSRGLGAILRCYGVNHPSIVNPYNCGTSCNARTIRIKPIFINIVSIPP